MLKKVLDSHGAPDPGTGSASPGKTARASRTSSSARRRAPWAGPVVRGARSAEPKGRSGKGTSGKRAERGRSSSERKGRAERERSSIIRTQRFERKGSGKGTQLDNTNL